MTNAESTLTPLAESDSAQFDWTRSAPVEKIVAALEAARPGSVRFVGGCVRDSLIGVTPKDIDIATTLTPQAVIDALHAASLKAAPTGVDHGTITGVADHVGVEITTLRADVSTDGRRATVAFTEDWATDARRRDFRLNAIYLTTDGKLFDPVGGVADAKTRRVRFIGAPEDRIREDYLRILRFFRFSARFAGGFDAEGLSACAQLREGMSRLSAERVGDEFTRILALPRAALAVDAMAACGVLAEVWPAPASRNVLRRLKELEPEAGSPVGLAALWGEGGEGIDAALRLPNAEAARRKRALAVSNSLSPLLSEREARAILYRVGVDGWKDGVLLAMARSADSADWSAIAGLAERWQAPVFAYTGKDIIAAGVERGPEVAKRLRDVEEAWIAEDFPSAERLREILKEKTAR